jgi:D-glycero-alpha-D-manno-heptose 1-phosphate guanylyltransferase
MNYPVIILAGGLGTRLSSVVKDLPKPMAPVAGKPFLHYIFASLHKQGIKNVILSVGYRYEAIQEFFGNSYLGIDVQYSIEQEPLGTGGGIKQAFNFVNDYAYVLNGDTFFDVPLEDLSNTYFIEHADMVLALKPLAKFDRYGTVELNPNHRITAFKEKEYKEEGLINGGVYFFAKTLWDKIETTHKFSFEKEVLEKGVEHLNFIGKVNEGYFIDIGIPEDYSKAQVDFNN